MQAVWMIRLEGARIRLRYRSRWTLANSSKPRSASDADKAKRSGKPSFGGITTYNAMNSRGQPFSYASTRFGGCQ